MSLKKLNYTITIISAVLIVIIYLVPVLTYESLSSDLSGYYRITDSFNNSKGLLQGLLPIFSLLFLSLTLFIDYKIDNKELSIILTIIATVILLLAAYFYNPICFNHFDIIFKITIGYYLILIAAIFTIVKNILLIFFIID